MTSESSHLVSLAQCGLELQAPQMLTTTKRRIRTEVRGNGPDGSNSFRYMAWDPVSVQARFTDLDPANTYELEAVYLSEEGVARTQSLSAGGQQLHPPTALPPGEPLMVRSAVPSVAIVNGSLEVRVDRVDGPDAVVSELRLYSSAPAPSRLIVVGDSRGGLIGSVSDAGYRAIADAEVVVTWSGGELTTATDKHGLFRVATGTGIPAGQDAVLDIVATSDGVVGRARVDTRELALGLRAQPTEADRIDLAGSWSFAPGWVGAPGSAHVRSTRVPGHIVFDGHVPEKGVATLWRAFTLPESWADDAVFLRFDGAYGHSEVFVNGNLAGTHGSGATSFDIDVSNLVGPGENVVSVTLVEYSPHSVIDYMSWYAHMSLLGIWRPVYLFRTERLHLGNFDLTTDWDPHTSNGSVDVGMDVINLGQVDADYQLVLEVRDLDGRTIQRMERNGSVGAAASTRQSVAAAVSDVEPWSAEIPRRYLLHVELGAQIYEQAVGFRRVEVRGNELLVNGSPIRILGVNRHDARMTSGRSLTTQQLRDDVLRFRQANVNTIRTSHYPADPRLLDICDELGMYVFQAAPVCWLNEGQWNRANDSPHLVPYLLEVTGETVARDKGHCCVIAWDMANESTWSWAFEAQLELVREMDPSRPAMFSFDLNEDLSGEPLDGSTGDARPELRSHHYPGFTNDWEQDLERFTAYKQPVICDEYIPIFEACQRYPHEAFVLPIDPGVRDYWVTAISPFLRRLFATRGCIGGMVWSGVDDLFAITHDLDIGDGAWAHLPKHDFLQQRDLFAVDDTTFFRGDGEWGLLDAWGRPRAELWHLAKMYSPIEISDVEFDHEGAALTCVVTNGFSHRSLADLSVVVRAGGSETAAAMSAPAGETARLSVDLPGPVTQVDLEFRHPEGWIVDGYGWTAPYAVARLKEAVLAGASSARHWPASLPGFHVQSADRPDIPQDLPTADVSHADPSVATMTVPLTGQSWSGTLTVSVADGRAEFGYACEYLGDEPINAREVGLVFAVPDALTELWWRREGDWSYYPPHHIGRSTGRAASAARKRDLLRPAPLWEDDGNEMGSNDFRSAKRNVHAAGLTDGQDSFSVLSTGRQAVRACLRDGKPLLHVLDWYGGVRTRDPVHPVWSKYFGGGLRIERGTVLRGAVSVVVGTLPDGVGG